MRDPCGLNVVDHKIAGPVCSAQRGLFSINRTHSRIHTDSGIVAGYTVLQLLTQGVVIDVTSDHDNLIFAFSSPIAVIDGEALAG